MGTYICRIKAEADRQRTGEALHGDLNARNAPETSAPRQTSDATWMSNMAERTG